MLSLNYALIPFESVWLNYIPRGIHFCTSDRILGVYKAWLRIAAKISAGFLSDFLVVQRNVSLLGIRIPLCKGAFLCYTVSIGVKTLQKSSMHLSREAKRTQNSPVAQDLGQSRMTDPVP